MNKVEFDIKNNALFEIEIKKAIDWLIRICDSKAYGWSWVPLIEPNIQNTSEVIYTTAKLISFLDDKEKNIVIKAIDKWILNIDSTKNNYAKISIDWSWALLALQKTRECDKFIKEIDSQKLQTSIDSCIKWLMENQNEDGGYSDNKKEKSSTSRTALALWGLSIEYKKNKDKYTGLEQTIKKAHEWIVKSQHNDGGWGNIRKRDVDYFYQQQVDLTYQDLRFQTDSNPACTGYAMVALKYSPFNIDESILYNAKKYLKNTQNKDGSWSLFLEVGIRDEVRYTFRHFGTTWALMGMLINEISSFNDEMIIYGFNYLAQLQDNNFGGWRCSIDADNYTWSTVNAILTINLVREKFNQVKTNNFLSIIVEWWDLKKNEANFSFHIGNTIFAFNQAMGLLFCIIFSFMMLFIMTVGVNALKDVFVNDIQQIKNIILGIYIVIMSIILGLPWVVYIKNKFNRDIQGWINSIGWVYGIITGFVLAFFQILL